MKPGIRTYVIAIVALALGATAATAHHSAAQFDFGQRVTIEGVVKPGDRTRFRYPVAIGAPNSWPISWSIPSQLEFRSVSRDLVSPAVRIQDSEIPGTSAGRVLLGEKILFDLAVSQSMHSPEFEIEFDRAESHFHLRF
jgi:hypothetical protein